MAEQTQPHSCCVFLVKANHKASTASRGGRLHSRVGKAEKSHPKGPGYDEGKTVVVCAIYHKDGPVFLQCSYRFESFQHKKLGRGTEDSTRSQIPREYPVKLNLY